MAFDTGAPRSREELGRSLNALLAEGTAFLTALPLPGFFAPQGAAWSPAEHVRHLELSSRPLALALKLPRLILRLRFGRVSGPSRDFAAMREAYLGALSRGATAGRFTPRPEPAPADLADRRAALLTGWAGASVELTGALAGWQDADLDRYQLPHPVMGPLTVREILCFTVYHTSHHLRRVAERAAA